MTNADIVMVAHEIVFLAKQAAECRDMAVLSASKGAALAQQLHEQRASSIDDDICTLCGNLRREIRAS